MAAHGDAEDPLSDEEIAAKFRVLAAGLGPERCDALQRAVAALPHEPEMGRALLDLVTGPGPGASPS